MDTGSSSRRLTYVKSGLIRAYTINKQGAEITVLLRWEDQFFSNFDAILWERPSQFTYEAFEDSVILETDYHEFMKVIDSDPKFAAAKTYFFNSMLAEALERIEGFVLLSPEERYLHLLTQKPGLAQRVSSKHLATLLGITPVSLSRIKKELPPGFHQRTVKDVLFDGSLFHFSNLLSFVNFLGLICK
ncbi:Crp/Fnr family transcriptional regulator [Niabella defluvii]|nr:Crp/Fnr family transcriptional regulator [Niabella sp. I65]